MNKSLALYNNYLQMWENAENKKRGIDDLKRERSFLKASTDNEVRNIRRDNMKNQGGQIRNVGASGVTVASQSDALDDMEVQARQKENFLRQEERKQTRDLSSRITTARNKRKLGMLSNLLALTSGGLEIGE